jgi:CheY-like chemotaxis protein
MMPEMDGYETMQLIRCQARAWPSVPLIAVTAKAMKGRPPEVPRRRERPTISPSRSTSTVLALLRVWIDGAHATAGPGGRQARRMSQQ